MFKRADGIVDFAKSICIGCKACIAACPYDAIFINPDDHSAEKCNFCAHRIDVGLEPACVVVCPVEAILVGDLNDPTSKVAQMVQRDAVTVRRPEKETQPEAVLQRRASGDARSARGAPARRRPVHVERAGSQRRRSTSSRGIRAGRTAPRPRCCRTTSPHARRGTGASASTRGRSRSPPAPISSPLLLVMSGYLSWREPALDERRGAARAGVPRPSPGRC